MTCMNYSKAKEWIVAEERFDINFLGKCEAIMSLGNGYMGLRSCTEEEYVGEKRNLFVAGTFNKFNDAEVTELPNAADLINMEIYINQKRFNLLEGKVKTYWRQLNLKTGELLRTVQWISLDGHNVLIEFHRIVSLADLHVCAQKVVITAQDMDVEIEIKSGINGRMSNSGSQHFSDGDKRFYDKKYMQFIQTTQESGIDFIFTSVLNFYLDGTLIEPKSHISMDRRKIFSTYKTTLKKNEKLVIEKISNVHTSRDRENENLSIAELQEKSLINLKYNAQKGYDKLTEESAKVWNKKLWEEIPITVDCENDFYQLAIRFAQYHLMIMTPAHDNRMSIAAKGLSGEGYKGHVFWDTDIFAVPYFTFSMPQVARFLEEYRYFSLSGARKKAEENGYKGAMFPWESAWLHDGEVTPVWGAADIVTGLPTKIMSGFIEQHITSDVSYCVWQYYTVTGDHDFMNRYGYEIIFDTAIFWTSRLEWDATDNLYHINNVVGPDEYKEEVDDNAFTNYMAHWNIKKAIQCYEQLKETNSRLVDTLDSKIGIVKAYEEWKEKLPLIFLPQAREDMIIPQDKTYLTLKDIDLAKYKNQENVGSLFLEYNLDAVRKMQVSKQADIMILFFLLEDLFPKEVKKANFEYYEARTLHDSSLSLSTHTILASDIGEKQKAYELFKKAVKIDLGENMKTSDEGIHAASIAGIWQSIVFGFGGVRMFGETLRIYPNLPEEWNSLNFFLYFQGEKLQVTIAKGNGVTVKNISKGKEVEIEIIGTKHFVIDEVHVAL